MLLDLELHKHLIFFYPLGGRGWLEWARVGYFPSPGKAVSDNIPAIQTLVSPEDRPCWEEPSALVSHSLPSPLPHHGAQPSTPSPEHTLCPQDQAAAFLSCLPFMWVLLFPSLVSIGQNLFSISVISLFSPGISSCYYYLFKFLFNFWPHPRACGGLSSLTCAPYIAR